MLEALSEIAILQNAVGSHACECGHPEMRLLPDGVFHCPACGERYFRSRPQRARARAAAGGRSQKQEDGTAQIPLHLRSGNAR